MRILLTASRSPTELLESLRKRGFVPEFIPAERVIDHMKGSAGNVSAADAFVCLTTYSGSLESELRLNDSARYSTAIKLAEDIRGLPESCAMSDGRKWKSLPFIFLIYELMGVAPAPDARMKGLSVTLVPFDDDDREPAFNLVRTTISEYLQRLLKEMDDLGFLVAYDHGRFKIGPALNPKRGIEGYYYYGPADKRKAGRKLFTVDRDLYGIKYEVEQFEALINNPVVSESDLQRFFEVHPHFLVGSNLAEPIPDPQFTDGDGNVLIPDFVLKPVVAQQRHTKWEILDRSCRLKN